MYCHEYGGHQKQSQHHPSLDRNTSAPPACAFVKPYRFGSNLCNRFLVHGNFYFLSQRRGAPVTKVLFHALCAGMPTLLAFAARGMLILCTLSPPHSSRCLILRTPSGSFHLHPVT